jgi:hypothetical protein
MSAILSGGKFTGLNPSTIFLSGLRRMGEGISMFAYRLDLELTPSANMKVTVEITIGKKMSWLSKWMLERYLRDELIPATHVLCAKSVRIKNCQFLGNHFVSPKLTGLRDGDTSPCIELHLV